MTSSVSLVVAVDGGGSKTDVLVATTDGTILARRLGPGSSQHALGAARATAVIDEIVLAALADAGGLPEDVSTAHCYLTAVDLPDEVAELTSHLQDHPWAQNLVLDNDVFALLRAGTDELDAAVVVVGTGINAAAVRADGARARFLALGRVSGDWGGGTGLAEAAVWAAARQADGRGPRTLLHDAVLRRSGRGSANEVSVALHDGSLDLVRLADLARDVLDAAAQGDEIALSLRLRQADEVAVMARSALARVDLADRGVPVVLGGGILRAGDSGLDHDIAEAFARELPLARPRVSSTSPVLGGLLLALGGGAAVARRASATYPPPSSRPAEPIPS